MGLCSLGFGWVSDLIGSPVYVVSGLVVSGGVLVLVVVAMDFGCGNGWVMAGGGGDIIIVVEMLVFADETPNFITDYELKF